MQQPASRIMSCWDRVEPPDTTKKICECTRKRKVAITEYNHDLFTFQALRATAVVSRYPVVNETRIIPLTYAPKLLPKACLSYPNKPIKASPSSNASNDVSTNHTASRFRIEHPVCFFPVDVAAARLPDVVDKRVPNCLSIALLQRSRCRDQGLCEHHPEHWNTPYPSRTPSRRTVP